MKIGANTPRENFLHGAAPARVALAMAVLALGSFPAAGMAQDDALDDQQAVVDSQAIDSSAQGEAAPQQLEEIVITGSRLRRTTYSSVSPLQIISGQVSREVGLVNAADILQESTAASGQQIDLTFGGFVLDNGPGASTINLRGLGAARTLALVNGRRLAPGGGGGSALRAGSEHRARLARATV